MARLSKAIEGNLSLFFERLGLRIYDHPWRVIAISVAVCALLAIGFVRFEIEYRGERLFTPQDSESFDHRDYVESVFGFDPRATDVYATSTSDGANILTKAQILAFLDMYEDIRNISVSKDGDTKTLLADCVQGSNGACDQTSVLDFWDYDRAAVRPNPVCHCNPPTLHLIPACPPSPNSSVDHCRPGHSGHHQRRWHRRPWPYPRH